MQLTKFTMIAASFVAAVSSPCKAHHDVAADVDPGIFMDLSGRIEMVEWINPHVVIHLLTEDVNGFNQTWLIQVDSPNSLLRKGINRASIAAMSTVQMQVYPSVSAPCSNDCYGYGHEFSVANGRTYILHQGIHDLLTQLTLQDN